jgi:hypothetical protein
MADNIENGGSATPQVEEKQFTTLEARAAEQGWRPKDEWEGEPDDWRTAREFLDRGEFFKKIEDQSRTIKELRKTQADLTRHLETVRKTEFKRALDSLKAQKRNALAEGDVEKVIEIDDEIAETRAQQAQAPTPQVPEVDPQMHPTFVAWKERNTWYESNKAMRAYADRLGSELTGSPSEILAEVERQVKKEFAHKFENPRRNGAPAVEGSITKPSGKKDEAFKLSDEERRVMQRFVRAGALTEEQYIKDLKEQKARGL